MGRRNSQRKSIAILATDDDDSIVSSSPTIKSNRISVSVTEEFQLLQCSVLDQALDALYEKRVSLREKALASIVVAFEKDVQHEFVEKKFATLLRQCLSCIKKGSSEEIALASRAIGLLALTVGCGDNAHEILEESVTHILQALKSSSESIKTVSLLKCLAVITFVGRNEPAETERSLQIMWQLVHPKLGSNEVAVEPSAPVITALVSAWAFLLTSMDGCTFSLKDQQECTSYFSGLLDKNNRSIRIAAGEALAVIFEMGYLENFDAGAEGYIDGSVQEGNKFWEGHRHRQGLKAKILSQVRDLSAEAGGKGAAKKDLSSQRNFFKNVLYFLEGGSCPETLVKIGEHSLQVSTWSRLIQLNFLRHFLGSGFLKHMQDNDLLHDIFEFMPKKKHFRGVEHKMSSSEKVLWKQDNDLHDIEFMPKKKHVQDVAHKMSSTEKRMYKSPNSVVNKARTRYLNKERMLSKASHYGHFAVDVRDE